MTRISIPLQPEGPANYGMHEPSHGRPNCIGRLLISGAWLIVAFVVLVPAAADIYKSTDARGNLVYSDRAPSGPAQRVPIETRPRNSEQARASLEAERAAWQRADAERAEREGAKAGEQAAKRDEQAKRCNAARFQQTEFEFGRRKFRLDSQGNRVYYSATEIDQKRAEAKQQIAEFCPPAPTAR